MVDTEKIKEFIKSLIKAKRNFRLYPADNPIYAATLDDVYSKIFSPLQYVKQITLTIKQYDIYSAGQFVYHNESRYENLSFFFFKDGIREISFLKGVSLHEMEGFMRVISSDFETHHPDDDIVTMMWEKDFQYIKYVVDDTILLEDRSFEQKSVEQVKRVSAGAEKVMKAYAESIEQLDAHKISVLPLTNEDLSSIIREIRNGPKEKIGVMIPGLIEMFSFAQGENEFEEITKGLKNTLAYAVNHGHIEMIIDSLLTIENAIEKQMYADDVISHLIQVKSFINTERFIELFGEAIESGTECSQEAIKRFALLFSKQAIPHFISLLGELTTIPSRKTVIGILIELGKKDIHLLAEGLNDQRWFLVRNIIHILGRIGDSHSVQYLIRMVRHDDNRVRKEAVRVLGQLGSKDVLNILKDCMSDKEEIVRITTARTIGKINSLLSKKILLDTIHDRNFIDVNFHEKKEVFGELSRWKESDIIDPLKKIMQRNVLLKRSKYDEVKAAAAYCLGMMGGERAFETLEPFKDSKNKLLRDHVEAALLKINHGNI